MALNRLKVGRGLQPVPEESAPNGTHTDSGPDDAAAPANTPDQCLSRADNAARNTGTATDRQFRSWSYDDAAAVRPLDGVSEKEYRIWFPRAEVADGEPTGRASSDWRTFREYRYTECSREGLLEKSLSVEQIQSSGKGSPTADSQQPAFPFHCVTCSMSDEDRSAKLGGGACRMLSSTKSQLYREHRERLLSRLEDDISSAAPLVKTEQKPKLSRASGEMGWEEGEASECQTLPEKIELACSSDDAKRGAEVSPPGEDAVSTSTEYLLLGGENEPSYQPGSAGFQDTSLVSEDDDFDDRKCTYVKVDSVDVEVEQGGCVGKEAVIGGPSQDDLGYIAEEPEDETEERTDDDPESKRLADTPTEKADQGVEAERTSSSELESHHQDQVSSQRSSVKDEFNAVGERMDAPKYSKNALYASALDATDEVAAITSGEADDRSKCLVGNTEDCSLKERNPEKGPQRSQEKNGVTEATASLNHSLSEADAKGHSSETRSVKSVGSLRNEIVPSANTQEETVDEELTNTVVEIEIREEHGPERCEPLITSQDLYSDQGASKDPAAKNEQCEAKGNGVTRHADSIGDSKEGFKDAPVFDSGPVLNNEVSDKVTISIENETPQLRENAAKVQERKDLLKDPQDNLDYAVIEDSEVLEVSPLLHHDEVQTLNQRRESVNYASTCNVEVKEHREETAENILVSVSNSVTQETVPDVQTGVGLEKNKEKIGQSAEREQNNRQQRPEIVEISHCEPMQEDSGDFFEADTLTERSGVAGHEVAYLKDAKENEVTTPERVSSVVDDPISITDATRDTRTKVQEEGENRIENADARPHLNGCPENAQKINPMPPAIAPEGHVLKESKVQRLGVLERITGVEELVRGTMEVVSLALTDSLSKQSAVADESLCFVKDNIKKEETLTELHNLRIDSNEATKSLLTNDIREVREVETVHSVRSFDESAAQSLCTASTVGNEETVDGMANVSHSLPHDSHHLIDLGSSSIQDKKNGEATEAGHDHLVAVKNVERDALCYNSPPTNVVLLEGSLSASIEAAMLRDVIALTKIDDATSIDASLHDDNDQGFESLPCDQALDPEDLNEAQTKQEVGDQREPQGGEGDSENVDNFTSLLDNLVGGEEDVKLSSSSEAQNIIADATGHNRESSFAQYAEQHNVTSSEHHDRQEKEDSGSARLEEGIWMTLASTSVETILGAPDEVSNGGEDERIRDTNEDNAEKGPEGTASNTLQFAVSALTEDVLPQHEELHEQGVKGGQLETSKESANVGTNENEVPCVSMETSASKPAEIVEASETATDGETGDVETVTEVTSTLHPEGTKTLCTELIIFDDIVALGLQGESCEETTLSQETADELAGAEPPLVTVEGDQPPKPHAEACENKEPEVSESDEASEHREIERAEKAGQETTGSSLDEARYGDIEHSVDSQVVVILTDPQHLLKEISGQSTLENLHICAESVREDVDPRGTTINDTNEPENQSKECGGYGTTKGGAESEPTGKLSSAIVEIETDEMSGTFSIEVQSADTLLANQQSPQKMSGASAAVDELAKQEPVRPCTDDNENIAEDAVGSERIALDKAAAETNDANKCLKAAVLDKDEENLTKSSLENTASSGPEITIDDYSIQTSDENADQLDESNVYEEILATTGNQEHVEELELFRSTNLDLKAAEISTIDANDTTFHDSGKDSEDRLAEAYNEHVADLSKNASVEHEDEDTRLTLRAYAEDIVSTVLTNSVTRLEEKEQNIRGVAATEKSYAELNVNAENAHEEAPIKAIPSGEKIEQSTSPKLEIISRSSSGGIFEPIATRQPAFEEAMVPALHQDQVVSAEVSQSVLSSISSISDENEEPVDETPSPPSMKEQRVEETSSEERDKAPATSESAKSSTTDGIPEDGSHDASLRAVLQSSEGQLELDRGEVDGTASGSESITLEQVEPISADNAPDELKASLGSFTEDGAKDDAHADAPSNTALQNSHAVQLSAEQLEIEEYVDGTVRDSSTPASEQVGPTSGDNVPDASKASVGSVIKGSALDNAHADAQSNAELQNPHAVQLSLEQLDVKDDVDGAVRDSSSPISEQVGPTSGDNVPDGPEGSIGLVTKDSSLVSAYADTPLNAELQNSHAAQLSKEKLDLDNGDLDETSDNRSASREQTEPTSSSIVHDASEACVDTGSVTNDGVQFSAKLSAPLNAELEGSHPEQLSGEEHEVDRSEMDETLHPPSTGWIRGEATVAEDVHSTLTSSEDARAVTTDSVLSSAGPGTELNAESVSAQMAPLTADQQQHEKDATDVESVSEAVSEEVTEPVTEEVASSGAESNRSVHTVRRTREASDQDVETTSKDNGKPDERKLATDASDGDAQEQDKATLHVPVETGRGSNESETLDSVEEAEPRALQESEQRGETPYESAPPIVIKPEVLTPGKDSLEEEAVSDGDDADTDAAANSYSESSLTTVSVDAKESVESVSEQTTGEGEHASEAVSIEAVTADNSSDAKKGETASSSETGLVDSSEMPAAVGADSKATAMPRENDIEQEDDIRFKKSNVAPDLSDHVEKHHDMDIQEFKYDSLAYKPAVFKSEDSFSRRKYPEELRKEDAENEPNDPNLDKDAEEFAKFDDEYDDYVSKHESTTLADNEKDSLGALSTVYESSLEYARSSIEENVTAADVNTTVSSDHEVFDTNMPTSEHFLLNNAIVVGGVFKQDDCSDSSDVTYTKYGFREPGSRKETFPSDHASNGGHRIDSGHEELENDANDPEKQSSSSVVALSVPREIDAVINLVGAATALDDEVSKSGAREEEVSYSQDLKDFRPSREYLSVDNLSEAVLNNVLPSQNKLDGNRRLEQSCGERVAAGTENTEEKEKKQGPGVEAPSHESETEAANFTEQIGAEISSRYEQFHRKNHVLEEQDEVAAMDFSEEEQPSLEDMHAHNYTVVADVHVSAHQESRGIQDGKLEKQSIRDGTALADPHVMATSTNDDKEVTNGATVTNEAQGGVRMQEQAAETEAKEPKAVSALGHPEGPIVEDSSDKLQPTVAALKTAVVVHEEAKLEALECSEELLHSVATEADFSSDVYEHTDDGQEGAVIAEINGEQSSEKASSAHGYEGSPLEEPESLDSGGTPSETKEPSEDKDEPPKKASLSDAVEDAIVPEHIPSRSEKSSTTESEQGSGERSTSVNGDLKEAVQKFSSLVTSGDASFAAADKKNNVTAVTPDEPAVPDATDQKAVPEESDGEDKDESRPRKTANAESTSSAEHEDSVKTDSSESIQLPTTGAENGFGQAGTKQVKDTTHNVTESVEQSERTEGGEDSASRDRVRSTRIFQKTVLRTESTRTVRKTRSFLPYLRNRGRDDARHAWQDLKSEENAEKPVKESCVAQQAFDAMSIPRRGLCPTPEPTSNVRCMAVQASPSTRDQEVQVEFDEHDCITRLVELQIAMNEQEEVRRQDMKAACELVEKLEAMQLSESLMRSQLRAMDAERREQMAREARLRDELQAWQETVQQQQLLLQQLKEDLDDTEDTLAAQRQEANRLREQVLVLQESCDSGLLMVDVLGRADKEVQTPDGGQRSLSTSSSLKGIRVDDSSPVYLDQLGQHRRLSALVGSQLEATANRIAQLRREALANRTRGGGVATVDDYIQDLAEKEAIVHQLLLEQQQMDELLSEHDKILSDGRRASLKSKEDDVTPTLQTEEEKLCLVGARCLHENHPELIARQARLLRRLQVDRIGVFRSPTPLDRSSSGSRRPEPPRRPYHALLTQYPAHRIGPRLNARPAGVGGTYAPGTAGSSTGGSDASGGRGGVGGPSADPRRITFSSASTAMTSRSSSHSMLRFSIRQQHQQTSQQQQAPVTAVTAPVGRGGPVGRQQGRQPQPQPAARKTDAERGNRFVTPSRGGNASKR